MAVALRVRVYGALAWLSGEAAAGQRRSEGGAMMAGWRAGGRCTAGPLGATAASRHVAERVSRRVRQRAGRGSARRPGACALERGREGSAARRGSAAAARQRGRGSGAASPVLECLRARAGEGQRGRERKERERGVEREKKVSGLTQSKLKIFN